MELTSFGNCDSGYISGQADKFWRRLSFGECFKTGYVFSDPLSTRADEYYREELGSKFIDRQNTAWWGTTDLEKIKKLAYRKA